MDLILWRHAEAEDAREGQDDLERALTSRGEKDAKRVAAWLDRQLPESARVFSSPARRCDRTAMALGRKFKLREELAPDTTAPAILHVAQWPDSRQPVVIVGHQPSLGQTAAQLIGLPHAGCAMRKGGVWWLRTRERDGHVQTLVWAVVTPEVI